MLTLILGGIRSGKSEHAESLAAQSPDPVTYLATARRVDADDDFEHRIQQHQARRPSTWTTVEVGADLADALRATPGTVLVDSLGAWVSGHEDFLVDIEGLVAALVARDDPTLVVSEEVGLSIHPPTALGRAFCDALGTVNRHVATVADSVVLVVAGRALPIA